MGRLLTVKMGKINETTFKQTRTFVYNTTGQLVSATNPENGTVSYTYMADGLLQSKTDAVNPTLSAVYEYDELNRLKTTTAGTISGGEIISVNWALQWSYDEFGNRLTQAGTGNPAPPPMTLAYDEATNRITTAGYSYDLNGNLTHVPQSQSMPEISNIAWDVFDRVTQATANGTTTQYKYDAFGRRVARVGPSGTDTFFYDMSGRLLAQHNGGWTPYKYVYFAGQKVGQYTDRLGSVRYTSAGGVVSHYYPYGELVAGTNNTGFKFAETYRDDSGLDYAMNRYYASGVGRFLSVDSGPPAAGNPQSWNRYTYVLGDPINYNDPRGLIPCEITEDGCPPLADGDGGYGTGAWSGCFLDGMPVSCEMAFVRARSGVALTPQQWSDWWVGMVTQDQIAAAAQAVANGKTADEIRSAFSQYLSTMGVGSDDISKVLGALQDSTIQGGHFNLTMGFSALEAAVGTDFASQIIFAATSAGAMPGDYGMRMDLPGLGSFHVKPGENPNEITLHLDIFDPRSGFGGILGHIFIDGMVGHIPGTCLDASCRLP